MQGHLSIRVMTLQEPHIYMQLLTRADFQSANKHSGLYTVNQDTVTKKLPTR